MAASTYVSAVRRPTGGPAQRTAFVVGRSGSSGFGLGLRDGHLEQGFDAGVQVEPLPSPTRPDRLGFGIMEAVTP